MPNRIVKESICTSENIDMLTPFQETVFIRLMVNCDDFGRFDGRAKVISSRLFPLRDIPTEDIAEALDVMQKADLIIIYEVDGKPYVQMKTWGKHQQTRASKSKYPSPDESNCNQLQSNDSKCNQMQSDDSKCPRNRIRNRNTIIDNRESLSLSENGLIDDDTASEIQNEHNRVLDAAEDAGFQMSNDVRTELIRLYSIHGLQKMLDGFKSCVKHSATNLAYLEACLAGKPKQRDKPKVIAQAYEQRDYSGTQEEMTDAFSREIEDRLNKKRGAS